MIYLLNEGGNSELLGKYYKLPKGVRKWLTKIRDSYKGVKTEKGYKRLCFILDSEKGIEYNEMKRIKNFFDNFKGNRKSPEYILNGGKPMYDWLRNTLNRDTQRIKDYKEALKQFAGVDNAYRKKHTKDRQNKGGVKTSTAKFDTKKPNKAISNGEPIKYINDSMKRRNTVVITENMANILRQVINEQNGYEAICASLNNGPWTEYEKKQPVDVRMDKNTELIDWVHKCKVSGLPIDDVIELGKLHGISEDDIRRWWYL